MSQTITSGLSRRGAFASVLAATAAALPVMASASPSGEDAALQALYSEFLQVRGSIKDIERHPLYTFGAPETLQQENKLLCLCEQRYGLLSEMVDIPARASSGLKAKAAALQALLPDILQDCDLGEESVEIKLVLSLLHDLTGGAQI